MKNLLGLLTLLALLSASTSLKAQSEVDYDNFIFVDGKMVQITKPIPNSPLFLPHISPLQIESQRSDDLVIGYLDEYKINMGQLFRKFQNTFSYDIAGRVTEIVKHAVTTSLDDVRIEYSYNESGYLIEKLNQTSNNNQWINVDRWTYQVDPSGKVLTWLIEVWTNGNWQNETKTVNSYNEHGKIVESESESWMNNQWVKSYRTENTYDDNHRRLTVLFQSFAGEGWINTDLYTYQHSDISSDYNKIWQRWINNTWENYIRISVSFNDVQKPLQMLLELWGTQNWINNNLTDFEYDDDGNNTAKLTYSWDGAWNDYDRTTNTFHSNGFYRSGIYERYNAATGEWALSDLGSFAVNQNGELYFYNGAKIVLWPKISGADVGNDDGLANEGIHVDDGAIVLSKLNPNKKRELFQLHAVKVFIYENLNEPLNIVCYDESGDFPGNQIFSLIVEPVGLVDGWNEIELTQSVTFSEGSLYLGVAGPLENSTIGLDTDTQGETLIYTNSNWETLQPGNIMVRAIMCDITNVNDKVKLTDHTLSQNYPNPFKSKTTVCYKLQAASFIVLKIFDVSGKEISTLVNEKQPPGNYEVEFDAKGLPSGIYYYKLTVGEYAQTKKMIIQK